MLVKGKARSRGGVMVLCVDSQQRQPLWSRRGLNPQAPSASQPQSGFRVPHCRAQPVCASQVCEDHSRGTMAVSLFRFVDVKTEAWTQSSNEVASRQLICIASGKS